MKLGLKSTVILLVLIVGLGLAVVFLISPKNPVAIIQVVDAAGKPVHGAVIRPEGLRPKIGAYSSGWYSWQPKLQGVANPPVTTDADGYVTIPYPKYVFEQIETGTLCLAVDHPEYVPDRPERIVSIAPPKGAPWRVRMNDLWQRVRHMALVTRPDPVVLQHGAVLQISVQPKSIPAGARLFVQAPQLQASDTNSWVQQEPTVVSRPDLL